MAKTIFEEMGGTYTEINGYLIPNNILPPEKENKPIGIWGQRHLRYIRECKRILYTSLLTSGKLNSYLADIDKQAENIFFWLVKQFAEKEDVTETLKANNQMFHIKKMGNIQARAREIVNAELIFA